MRKVLLRFVFDDWWRFAAAGNEHHVGIAWALLLWGVIAVCGLYLQSRHSESRGELLSSAIFWIIPPAFLLFIGVSGLPLRKTGIPIFGYGFMLFIGFSTATVLAARRAKRTGADPAIIWDLMMWLLIPGIIGARVIHLLQNWDHVFSGKRGINALIAAVALWDGGIVFYGCIIGGVIGLVIYCRRRQFSVLELCDILMPSLLLGLAFGRIGCFLYGCCYGLPTSLPWGVEFPRDSQTFSDLVGRELLQPDAACTMPLHPTQLYSSVAAFILSFATAWYFRQRPFRGAVLCVGGILYAVNRFLLEIVRDDERGRLGTDLTFSQLVSIGLLIGSVGLLTVLWRKWRSEQQNPAE